MNRLSIGIGIAFFLINAFDASGIRASDTLYLIPFHKAYTDEEPVQKAVSLQTITTIPDKIAIENKIVSYLLDSEISIPVKASIISALRYNHVTTIAKKIKPKLKDTPNKADIVPKIKTDQEKATAHFLSGFLTIKETETLTDPQKIIRTIDDGIKLLKQALEFSPNSHTIAIIKGLAEAEKIKLTGDGNNKNLCQIWETVDQPISNPRLNDDRLSESAVAMLTDKISDYDLFCGTDEEEEITDTKDSNEE